MPLMPKPSKEFLALLQELGIGNKEHDGGFYTAEIEYSPPDYLRYQKTNQLQLQSTQVLLKVETLSQGRPTFWDQMLLLDVRYFVLPFERIQGISFWGE